LAAVSIPTDFLPAPTEARAVTDVPTLPNPDLTLGDDNKPRWNQPDFRRHGFHNLHRLARYVSSFRSARVMTLTKQTDLRIADLESVRHLTSIPEFSAMVVVRGAHMLFERYAPDFGPLQPHSIQSISKTMMNLIIGRMVEEGRIDPNRRIGDYLPWIGSGYRSATVQQALNMDVVNDYSEDYADAYASVYRHEEAEGWRLPADSAPEVSTRGFVATIESDDTTNDSGAAIYKSANSDVLALLAESVSGRPLRSFVADIADSAGLEGSLHVTTDREGMPWAAGGACLTARDLARYGSIFVRRGRGIDGRAIGGEAFIEAALRQGIPMPPPPQRRYSNQLMTDGRWVGHGGYGGQFMLADLTSGVVGVYFSVMENKDGYDADFYLPVIGMLSDVGRLDFAPGRP
jgi:CubicO group peptidase (beta-lactamase class C family)